jgi:hypothetical protein
MVTQERKAHNLKVVGSNPTPATNLFNQLEDVSRIDRFLPVLCRSAAGLKSTGLYGLPSVLALHRQ